MFIDTKTVRITHSQVHLLYNADKLQLVIFTLFLRTHVRFPSPTVYIIYFIKMFDDWGIAASFLIAHTVRHCQCGLIVEKTNINVHLLAIVLFLYFLSGFTSLCSCEHGLDGYFQQRPGS